MMLLIIVIFIIAIVIFLCKKFNVNRKIISIITIIVLIIGIIIFLLNKFDVLNKILYARYSNMPTITQEQRNNAIVTIQCSIILGMDASSYETYYIFNSENNIYYYLKTARESTIAGLQEEKIKKKEKLTNRKQLERIINKLEKKMNLDFTDVTLTICYQGEEIKKESLLDKMFPN